MWYHAAVRCPRVADEVAARLVAAFRSAVFVCFRRYSLLFSFILFYSVLIASIQSALVTIGADVLNIIIKYVFSGQGAACRG